MGVSKIWVLAEATGGNVATITLELLAKARELADTTLFDFASLRARPRVDDALIRAVNVG